LLFNIGGTIVNVAVAGLVGWIAASLRERSGRSRRIGAVMRRLSAVVFLYLAVQFALGQRTRP
jgi:threonine/homoserine/homoserine lactone efflux protein